MGYIQVQFYKNDFNNNYCGGVARAETNVVQDQ